MKKLSPEELAKKRASIRCPDYSPLPGSARCQHYCKSGSCKRDDYFMCVEWIRKNPDQVDSQLAERLAARAAERREKEAQSPPVDSGRVAESAERAEPPANRPHEYDASTLLTERAGASLAAQGELLTESVIADLASQGLVVEAKAADGTSVTILPEYTSQDRMELTYEHARALVAIMQVFPGSQLESIRRPSKTD